MSLYEERKAKMIENARIRKEQEIQDFLSKVDKVINNLDSIVYPSIQVIKETEKCYINYYVSKYPNCLVYSMTRRKKEYPFEIYYSKEFYSTDDIGEEHKKVFAELENHFN